MSAPPSPSPSRPSLLSSLLSSLLILLLLTITAGGVKLSQDGNYSGLTVSIEETVSQENCEVILQNIKVSPLST